MDYREHKRFGLEWNEKERNGVQNEGRKRGTDIKIGTDLENFPNSKPEGQKEKASN